MMGHIKNAEDEDVNKNLDMHGEKMVKGANISVMMTTDKVLKAMRQTDKIRKVQEEHEEKQREKMERVFSDYVQRRIDVENKVVSIFI